jgi:SNF2 family DNA or RNA helicase
LKQACFSPELYGGSPKSSKVEELKQIVEELVASGEKAIIFSQWSKACEIMKRELADYNPAYVTGKIRTKLRHEEQRRFNEDPDCHLYIGTIDANREAINLGIATYVIFTDEGWTPAGNDQAIGRSAAGGLRGASVKKGVKVTVIVMQAEDTYEQNVEALLKKKRAIFDRTVERDGGKIRKIEKVTLNDLRKALSRKGQKKSKVKV